MTTMREKLSKLGEDMAAEEARITPTFEQAADRVAKLYLCGCLGPVNACPCMIRADVENVARGLPRRYPEIELDPERVAAECVRFATGGLKDGHAVLLAEAARMVVESRASNRAKGRALWIMVRALIADGAPTRGDDQS